MFSRFEFHTKQKQTKRQENINISKQNMNQRLKGKQGPTERAKNYLGQKYK